jgi:hypothetical protein
VCRSGNHLVLVPWTRELSQHLGQSVAIQLDAARQVTRVLVEAPRRERDLAEAHHRQRDRGFDLG